MSSYEFSLVKAQIKAGAGIFKCDLHAVFSQDGKKNLGRVNGTGPLVESIWFQKAFVGRSDDGFAANTEIFMPIWAAANNEGSWKRVDWTIKADPDAVVLPWRVRAHLGRATG